MSEKEERREGWGLPAHSRKWHYFTKDGMSLCGHWGFFFGDVEQGNDTSPDNCKNCRDRLLARRAKAGENRAL